MAALKLTFPTQLPKNEKDLICMLLAGRLKDLFKGKLICAQLALDDLLKDVAGVSALGSLQSALNDMKSALNGFKTVSGYDNILHGINQALGQVNNVFSLGGLCPSPVRAPKIPDLLAQLNANMFGQANNILSSLGKLSNPSMCLGGGPGGFGINWNSMPGDLRNLRDAIKQAKNSNLGMTPALNAFTSNLKSQTSRMKGEIKRLEKNLADPLGLNEKLSTSKNIQRVKSISDGYPVKDAKGILHPNVLKSMVSADVESTIDNGDRTPVKYVTKPILDYCGDVVGFEKVAVTGDPKYIGWDPNMPEEFYDSKNIDNTTVNPVAGYSSYTYTFKQEDTVIKVYDTSGAVVTDLKLTRGIAYRLGFELTDKKIKFYSDSAHTISWTEGLTYSRSPTYGTDMEIILPDLSTTFVRGELDWSVLIETPNLKPTFLYTPDIIYWKTMDGTSSGSFSIDGDKVIHPDDRTYDVSMAVKKSCLQLVHETNYGVQYETPVTTRTYNSRTRDYDANGGVIESLNESVLSVITTDVDTIDGKIITTITKFNNTKYLITKRYVSVENNLEYNKIYYYISSSTLEKDATECILIKLDNPLSVLNSSKLPYTDHYSYKLTRLVKDGEEFIPSSEPISNSDETKFELLSNGKIIRWNLTSYSEEDVLKVPKNDFILQIDIEIDSTDIKRTFIDSNPIEYKTYFYFKRDDGTAIDSTIISNGNVVSPPGPLPTSTPVPTTVSNSSTVYGLSLIFG